MSKVNSVGPTHEDGEAYPLRYIGDGANASGSRAIGNEHVIGGIPSNWNPESSPIPKPDTEREDKHTDNTVSVDWDEELDPGHNYNDRILETNTDKDNYARNKPGINFHSDQPAAMNGKRESYGEYTPALPPADKLDETQYESPDSSETDGVHLTGPVNSKDTAKDAPKSRQKLKFSNENDYSKSPGTKSDARALEAKEETNLTHDKYIGLQEGNSDSRKRLAPNYPNNRVSPTDYNKKEKSKTQSHTLSEEELKRKKNFVFGDLLRFSEKSVIEIYTKMRVLFKYHLEVTAKRFSEENVRKTFDFYMKINRQLVIFTKLSEK